MLVLNKSTDSGIACTFYNVLNVYFLTHLFISTDPASADSSTGTGSKTKRTLNMADILSGIVTADVQTALQTLRFGGEATLQDIVYSLSASIDAKLLNLMMSRFYVQTHLLALKKFMLLGQVGFYSLFFIYFLERNVCQN